MEKMEILILLLPIVFMIHDFEEIIMLKPWLNKNRGEIKKRFPKFENFLKKMNLFNLSTSAFAIAVLHEFVLISLVTIFSLVFEFYELWFGAFAVYFLHLFVHIIQWVMFKKYVPVIVTSILTLPYCIYTLFVFVEIVEISSTEMLLWALIGIIVTILSFPSAFYLAFKFENWKNSLYLRDCKRESI